MANKYENQLKSSGILLNTSELQNIFSIYRIRNCKKKGNSTHSSNPLCGYQKYDSSPSLLSSVDRTNKVSSDCSAKVHRRKYKKRAQRMQRHQGHQYQFITDMCVFKQFPRKMSD